MNSGTKLTGRDVLDILKRMPEAELDLPVLIPERDSEDGWDALEDIRVERHGRRLVLIFAEE